MGDIVLRDATEADFARIVLMNAAEETQTSAMDASRLGELHALSCHHRIADLDGDAVAFLLAMDDRAAYDNANFSWFSARLPHFFYIDRIVVDAAAAGLGIGRSLYADLFDHMRRCGIGHAVCEYNLEPPNPASAAFHRRQGFHEIGRQSLSGGKFVSMQHLDLSKDIAQ